MLQVGALVTPVKKIPVRGADLAALATRKLTPASATLRRSWRIFLRFSGVRVRQKGIKVGIARVCVVPMKLHGVAQQQA